MDGFSSGASSLLWPLCIAACFAVFGIHEYFPLVLNVLCVVGLIFYAGYVVRRTTGSGWWSLLVLAAITFLTPLLAMASTGMEHALQSLLAVVFVDLAARLLTHDAQRLTSPRACAALCVTGPLLVMTRYEGLFLVAPVGLLLLCQRRWALAVLLGVASTAPIILFGLFAVSKSWYFFPNSLLIKANAPVAHNLAGLLTFLSKWYEVLLVEHHMFVVVAAVTAALIGTLRRHWTLWSYPALFLSITLLATLQHLQFAGIGWFYRYEAYLIVLSLLGLGVAFGFARPLDNPAYWRSVRVLPLYLTGALAALLFGAPLWTRAMISVGHVAAASYSIYRQQYQMGRFVRRYYRGKGVAANDLGAISFFADSRFVDVVGLSDIDVLRARRAFHYTPADVSRLCAKRHVEMAVIYDEWTIIYGGLPSGWVQIGRWTIPFNAIAGSNVVSFYAPDMAHVSTLTHQLQEFHAALPKDIIEDGLYRGEHPSKVTGTFGPEKTGDTTYYWVESWAQFVLYPALGVPLGSNDTTLALSVFPANQGESFDVFFNDQLVQTVTPPADAKNTWVPFRIPAKWRGDVNTVRLVGHGTPVQPPGDARHILYRVIDPHDLPANSGQLLPP